MPDIDTDGLRQAWREYGQAPEEADRAVAAARQAAQRMVEEAQQQAGQMVADRRNALQERRRGHASNVVNRALGIESEALGIPFAAREVFVVPADPRAPRGQDVVVTADRIEVTDRALTAFEQAYGGRPLVGHEAANASFTLQRLQREVMRAAIGGTTNAREGAPVLSRPEANLRRAIYDAIATPRRAEFMERMGVSQPVADVAPLPSATPGGMLPLPTISRYIEGRHRAQGISQVTQANVIDQLLHSNDHPHGAMGALTDLALSGYDRRLYDAFNRLPEGDQAEIVNRVGRAVGPALAGDPLESPTATLDDGSVARERGRGGSRRFQRLSPRQAAAAERGQGFGTQGTLAGLRAATELHKVMVDVAEDLGQRFDIPELRNSTRSAEREKADFELFMATKACGQTNGRALHDAETWRTGARRTHLWTRTKEAVDRGRQVTVNLKNLATAKFADWREVRDARSNARDNPPAPEQVEARENDFNFSGRVPQPSESEHEL